MANLQNLRAAEIALVAVGLMVSLTGVFALLGAASSTQGELPLLLICGLALVLFGGMIAFRWNLGAAKSGLVGLTAGYFAASLSAFEVATDPCDIGAALERCATDVVTGTPWAVYQGPLFVAVLAFAVILLEPHVRTRGGN